MSKPQTDYFIVISKPFQFEVQTDKGPKLEDFGVPEYVIFVVENDERFSASVAGFRLANRLVDLFEGRKPGDVVKVHPEDFKILKPAAESPSGGMPALNGIDPEGRPGKKPMGRKLQPVIDCITLATMDDPRPEVEVMDAVESAAQAAG